MCICIYSICMYIYMHVYTHMCIYIYTCMYMSYLSKTFKIRENAIPCVNSCMQILREMTSFNEYSPCDRCYSEYWSDKLAHFLFPKQLYKVNVNRLLKIKTQKPKNTLESGFEFRLSVFQTCVLTSYIVNGWREMRELELGISFLAQGLTLCLQNIFYACGELNHISWGI